MVRFNGRLRGILQAGSDTFLNQRAAPKFVDDGENWKRKEKQVKYFFFSNLDLEFIEDNFS